MSLASDNLAEYFVETDQFAKLMAGEIDIVLGPKGAGKSAMYASMLDRASLLFDQDIVLISGENPRGETAFAGIVAEPPTSEFEFIGLWKLYILTLLTEVLDSYEIRTTSANEVRAVLADAGLITTEGLANLIRRIRDYVASFRLQSIEGHVKIDPLTGIPTGFGGKISLGEPSSDESARGIVSVTSLLRKADHALSEAAISCWVLFDRLDVAFEESRELETNALRSLFHVYQDMKALERVDLKIFLRNDIWKAITETGLREASHITKAITIEWSSAALLNVVVRRLVKNKPLLEKHGLDPTEVLSSATTQRAFFDSLVPDKIDSGQNPRTFEWLTGRVTDGTGAVAPRELIHLLTEARNRQLQMMEHGVVESDEEPLFSRQAFRDALPEVSRVRLQQTLYAEYPEMKSYLEALEREKTEQTPATLARIWGVTIDDALDNAKRLQEIGFFLLKQGPKDDPHFWVPFLYRPALHMVQGAAE
jgi:hypothetical protein